MWSKEIELEHEHKCDSCGYRPKTREEKLSFIAHKQKFLKSKIEKLEQAKVFLQGHYQNYQLVQ